MTREAGKGSKSRPFTVSQNVFKANWDNTFKKTVKLQNPLNKEVWWCDNVNETRSVDGVDYITVYKKETPTRTHLMRKTALSKSN
jgi:hypothetical protein